MKGWSAQAIQGCAVLVLCGGYVCASIAQQVYWGSDLLMLTRGEALYPGNPYAGAGLAKEYSQRGAHDRAIELAESVVRTIRSMVMGRWRWRKCTSTRAGSRKAAFGSTG